MQEAGWAPGPVWTGAEYLAPTEIRSPDRPARSESLYRLSYPGRRTVEDYRKLCGYIGPQISGMLTVLTILCQTCFVLKFLLCFICILSSGLHVIRTPQFYFSLDQEMCETGPAKAIHVLKPVVLSYMMLRSLLLNGCLNTKYSGYSTKL